MRRDRFRHRLEVLASKLGLLSDEDASPEGRWRASLTEEEREADDERCHALIEAATSEELDALLKAFSVPPSRRGAYLLWPRPQNKGK